MKRRHKCLERFSHQSATRWLTQGQTLTMPVLNRQHLVLVHSFREQQIRKLFYQIMWLRRD